MKFKFLIVFIFAALTSSVGFAQFRPIVRFNDNQISLADALKDMKKDGTDRQLAHLIYQMVAGTRLVNLPEDQFLAALSKAESADISAGDEARFPLVPLALFGAFDRNRSQQLGASHPAAPPAALPDIAKELETLNSKVCTFQADPLKNLAPNIQEGGFEDMDQTPCEKAKSVALAGLLNRLAVGEFAKSPFQFAGANITSTDDLLKALLASGHTVRLYDGRTFANFLDFVYKGQSVIMPFWMETGLTTKSGKKIILPTGHSEWTWQISGPIVTTTVRFYQGESGMGFDSTTGLRPRWSGYKTNLRADSSKADDDKDKVLKSVAVAGGLIRRNRIEGAGLWNSGYGYTGVCDDTTADLDAAVFGEVSVYPELRHPDLLAAGFPKVDDDLNDIFAGANRLLTSDIPTATPLTAEARLSALKRIVAMQPNTIGNYSLTNTKLRTLFEEIQTEINCILDLSPKK